MALTETKDLTGALGADGFSALTHCFSDGAVTVFDHDLRCVSAASRGRLDDIGMTGLRLKGRTLAEVYPPEIVAILEPIYRRALEGQESTFDIAFGGSVYLQRLAPLRDGDNVIVGSLGITQDVTAERQAARNLSESEEQFRTAFEHAPFGKALIALDGRYLQANQALCEMLGYSDAQLRNLTAEQTTFPDDLARDIAGLGQLCAGELRTYDTEKRFRRATGELVWAATSASLVRHQDGSPRHFISQIHDISQRKTDEHALAEERRRLRAAQSIGRIGSWETDVATGAITWSDTLFELYGLEPSAFGGDLESALLGIHPDDVDELRADLHNCTSAGVPMSNRHRIYRSNDGELRWFDARAERIEDGAQTRVVGLVVDVTEQVLAEARLKHAALHDTLTGLPNRRLVVDRLGRALDRSEREGQVAVLFCDLDGFKRVNDVHGHQAGDAVLVEAAARIVGATRSGDTVGRIGGDEFVVICGVPRGEDPIELAHLVTGRIERAMAEPIGVDGLDHRVTVSIGICLADQGDIADVVIRNADVAMSLAKSRGKNGHAVFEASLRSAILDRDSIEQQIVLALDNDTLEVYYQPIVEPRTGRVCSVEALLRVPDGAGWHLDTYQAVTVAEQTGIISLVGERVLELACVQVAAWRLQPGHADLKVSVNRSAAEIARPGLYRRIIEVLTATGLDPGALTIEITESVLLDAAPHTITDLGRLRAAGIGIAIDDFGTGYASLHYLATLPISCLKVDSSFTAGLPHDPTCVTILCATVGLAADLGMGCVVEGVETTAQLDALPVNSKLLVQGFLYARPQPAAAGLPTHLSPLDPNAAKP